MIQNVGFKHGILLLLIALSIVSIACKKQEKVFSKIENVNVDAVNGVAFECSYDFPFMDKGLYGLCWSSVDSIPKKGNYTSVNNTFNYVEYNADFNNETKRINVSGLPSASSFRARAYITFEGGSTVYSKEYVEFTTGIFEDLDCNVAENSLIVNGVVEQITSSNYSENGGLVIIAETSQHTIDLKFQAITTQESPYYVSSYYYAIPQYDNEVGMSIKHKNTNCIYSNMDYGNFYVYALNYENKYIYIKFCSIALQSGSNCQGNNYYEGMIKVVL